MQFIQFHYPIVKREDSLNDKYPAAPLVKGREKHISTKPSQYIHSPPSPWGIWSQSPNCDNNRPWENSGKVVKMGFERCSKNQGLVPNWSQWETPKYPGTLTITITRLHYPAGTIWQFYFQKVQSSEFRVQRASRSPAQTTNLQILLQKLPLNSLRFHTQFKHCAQHNGRPSDPLCFTQIQRGKTHCF